MRLAGSWRNRVCYRARTIGFMQRPATPELLNMPIVLPLIAQIMPL